MYPEYLMHYGVKGQKWGVRRQRAKEHKLYMREHKQEIKERNAKLKSNQRYARGKKLATKGQTSVGGQIGRAILKDLALSGGYAATSALAKIGHRAIKGYDMDQSTEVKVRAALNVIGMSASASNWVNTVKNVKGIKEYRKRKIYGE